MTEQNEIITPVFKNRPSNLQKHSFTARPAVKINVNEVELTIFKGKQSVSTRLAIKNLVSYTKSNLSTGGFFYGRKTRYCSTNF